MTIRWGLLGCGDIARKRVARAIIDQPRSRLLAACRRDGAKLREFCLAYGIERGYEHDYALLADPDVDAVYIATPVTHHLPQTLAAAAAGKHVLVEKPTARTVAKCDRMIAACRERGVQLGVTYYRRFYQIVARMARARAQKWPHLKPLLTPTLRLYSRARPEVRQDLRRLQRFHREDLARSSMPR